MGLIFPGFGISFNLPMAQRLGQSDEYIHRLLNVVRRINKGRGLSSGLLGVMLKRRSLLVMPSHPGALGGVWRAEKISSWVMGCMRLCHVSWGRFLAFHRYSASNQGGKWSGIGLGLQSIFDASDTRMDLSVGGLVTLVPVFGSNMIEVSPLDLECR